eukprot:TRINITY_DN15093_c0_g5_i1.p1 TRINITY_DN15093_c0_g5~~TRINITY_DN15093_c0_g5_i1.p1  ORF type:complete len:3429 (-),score=728.45 TRINITY_DN15093_c0_g5_i1:188-10474(-)
MIQTGYGPVGLRRPRQPQSIILHGGNGQPITISKDWLKGKKNSLEDYRLHVKQAMMIASAQVEREDVASGLLYGDLLPNGQPRTPKAVKDLQNVLKEKIAAMQQGTTPVPLAPFSKAEKVKDVDVRQDKFLLVKRSKKCGTMRHRAFNINNGRLLVYKSPVPNIKAKHVYDLKDVVCVYENRRTVGVVEPFLPGYDDRVCIQVPERPHGPMYLYTKDSLQASAWVRAVKMSKYLEVPSDREALRVVVGRVACCIGKKGWDAMFVYAKEMQETKRLVRAFSMRLLRVEISRGWNKVRTVYQQRVQNEALRKEQREWATRFLKDKMDRINNQAARPAHTVRRSTISAIHAKFRHFREEQIFDRMYPLGSPVCTRMQQAVGGTMLMCAFESLAPSDILMTLLANGDLQSIGIGPDAIKDLARKATYSEVCLPLTRSTVAVSDSLSHLSFSEVDENVEHSNLARAGWANFVSMSRISSVVLHSDRVLGDDKGNGSETLESTSKGAWFTIYGPRVGWCRKTRMRFDPQTNQDVSEVVGTGDGMALPAALARGDPVNFLKVSVIVRSAHVPMSRTRPSGDGQAEEAVSLDGDATRQTYMVLHLLGRRFVSERQPGDTPQYRGRFEAEVPLPTVDAADPAAAMAALAMFDEQDVGIDIMEWDEDDKLHRTVWSGKCPLWKLFAPDSHVSIAESAKNGIRGAQEVFGIKPKYREPVFSLEQSLAQGRGQGARKIALSCDANAEGLFSGRAFVELETSAQVAQNADTSKRPISPELMGRGPVTSLYSSVKGTWYDPKLGKAKFSAETVANFVEFRLDQLVCAQSDAADDKRIFRYYVEARCAGVTVSSKAMHRALPTWSKVLPCDTKVLELGGQRLFLPLPPGCWCRQEAPMVELTVFKVAESDAKTFTFRTLLAAAGKGASPAPSREEVCKGVVSLAGLALDQPRAGANVLLGKKSAQAPVSVPSTGSTTPVDDPSTLVATIVLRDRDFVRLQANTSRADRGFGSGTYLCVGDKATMPVEEPINYPKTEQEHRRRFAPDDFQPELASRGAAWVTNGEPGAPLRDPSMSHEFSLSGLDKLPQPPQFKQRYIPSSCEDILPHKYVMPTSEQQFIEEARPGVFWRVVDSLANSKQRAEGAERQQDRNPIIVDRLSHLTRHVPVTVLAVYPNGTCDLEIAPYFMHDWERHPHRELSMPGAVVVKEFRDTSMAAMRSAAVGTGDVGETKRRRTILREVPVSAVTAVQEASFNIYDAAFATTEEAIQVHPAKSRNDYNVRDSMDEQPSLASRRGGYSISAGPLPMDVGASCQHEWALRLHAPTEDDMYQFVTMLRQCVRLDIANQVSKMQEFKSKAQSRSTGLNYTTGGVLTNASGNLEVVLVEARNLRPAQVMPTAKDLKHWVDVNTALELNPSVKFTIRKGNGEALVYRGSKSQVSMSMQNTINPDWSKERDLKSSGGWSFKTPLIEPTDLSGLVMELEVVNTYKIGGMQVPLGSIRVPVSPGADGDAIAPGTGLCDPKDPFHNLWLPLCTEKDGVRVPTTCGEIHVMTLWVPKNPVGMSKRLPKTPRAFLAYQLRPRQLAPQVRDPRYELQVQKPGYNPNTSKEEFPPTRSEYLSFHNQRLLTNNPYYECTEQQMAQRWSNYFGKLLDKEMLDPDPTLQRNFPKDFYEGRSMYLYEKRIEDARGSNAAELYELSDLLRRGVPPTWRGAVWADITHATAVSRQFGVDAKGALFQRYVEEGAPLQSSRAGPLQWSDAMVQLQEDAVGAALWETSQQPALLDLHLRRVKCAQDVCTALITFTAARNGEEAPCMKDKEHISLLPRDLNSAVSVAYCESLFPIAFMLVLPQRPLHPGESVSPMEEREAQSNAFWLLYTLICSPGNGFLRAYYGSPPGYPRPHVNSADLYSSGSSKPFIERSGAMEDVFLLEKCVQRWERQVYIHMKGLGFQLSSVFYSGFMKLFAFMLPTCTLFRFWDMLFASSTDPRLSPGDAKPRRHTLIDFAFHTVRACRADILKCDSALEVKDTLLNYIESLYDPSVVLREIGATEAYLWENRNFKDLLRLMPHVQDLHRALDYYDYYLDQFRHQNETMRKLVRETQMHPVHRGAGAASNVDQRLTTMLVVTKIMPSLQRALLTNIVDRTKSGGFFRPVTSQILNDFLVSDDSMSGTMMQMASRWGQRIWGEAPSKCMAHTLKPPEGTMGEPPDLKKSDFQREVDNTLREFEWKDIVATIVESFGSPHEKRMSLNEFFCALICCSRGTVGEKALALFHLYSSGHDSPTMQHIVPVTPYAKAVCERVEGSHDRASAQVFMAPTPEQVKTDMALHFRIWTYTTRFASSENSGEKQGVLVGEVFIPSLKPYTTTGFGKAEVFESFTIWSPWMTRDELGPGANIRPGMEGTRTRKGEATICVRWCPAKQQKPEVGQLGVYIENLYLDPQFEDAPFKKNPWVTMVTYKNGTEEQIKCWDPRTASRKIASTATMSIAYGGAFGGYMGWEETMRRDVTGGLHYKVGSGTQGWVKPDANDPASRGVWRWSKKWGNQHSIDNFEFDTKFCGAVTRANTISLQACRIITQQVLNRSLACVTNRDAALIADQTFNRAGANPAILDAILVRAPVPTKYKTPRELIEDEDARGTWQDCKAEVLRHYEASVASTYGSLNLFPKDRGAVSLGSLNITDNLGMMGDRVLWIRYSRSGDGERGNRQIVVDRGNLVDQEVVLDMDLTTKLGQQQMLITKEEFVSCFLNSSVLSDPLRQFSTAETSAKGLTVGKPMKLDVSIYDPDRKDEDEEILDALNVRQSVILELWDFDVASKHDFLGEVWLPSIGTLRDQPKRFVLDVRGPGHSDDGTRPDAQKHRAAGKCVGQLHVEASWTFPKKKVTISENASVEERVEGERANHTGELYIKIIKATGLRCADIRRSKGSDPYCIGYVRNEAYGDQEKGWRTTMAGLHEPILRTNWKKSTIDPVWEEEFKIDLMTGAFDKKTRMSHFNPALTGRAQQRKEIDRNLKVISNTYDLRIVFGEEPPKSGEKKDGTRHGVQVYEGDTIHQFKHKMALACREEALAMQKDAAEAQKKGDNQLYQKLESDRMRYQAASESMSIKHVVMVFQPSQQLRELAQAHRENSHAYKRMYDLEVGDPSSWQPLDTIRTFNHYARQHGFGVADKTFQLRIAEGTEAYKLKNTRYRSFDEDMKKRSVTVRDENTSTKCYGYVKYIHLDDGSTEWRPALLEKPEGYAAGTFKASYIYSTPRRLAQETGPEAASFDVREEEVLLAPANPKLLSVNILAHKEFLAKAPALLERGFGEKEILEVLNAEIHAKYAGAGSAEGAQKPEAISAAELQNFLRMYEANTGVTLGSTAGSAASATGAGVEPPALTASSSSMLPAAPAPAGASGYPGAAAAPAPAASASSTGPPLQPPAKKGPSLAPGAPRPAGGPGASAGPSMGVAR